jgi:rod shape determining protein RodA
MVAAGLWTREISTGLFTLNIPYMPPAVLPRFLISELAPFIIAAGVFFAAYFTDIKKLGWIPFAACLALVCLVPAVTALLGSPGGRTYYYLQYVLFPAPVAASVLVCRMKLRGYSGLAVSLLLFIVPAAVALLIGSAATFTIICATCIAVLTTAVLKGYFGVKKRAGLAAVFGPFAAAFLVFLNKIAPLFQVVLNQGPDPHNNWGMRLMLSNTGFTKGLDPYFISDGNIPLQYVPYYDDTNGLDYMITRFGWFIFVIVLVLVIALAVFLIRLCLKQRSRLGFTVSVAVSSVLLAQTAVYIAANLGFMLFPPLPLPLLAHGGLYLILDVALIGVLLSVNRTDMLAEDRLKKERQKQIS